MRFKLFFILVFVFFISSCATTENHRKLVDSWKGRHSDDLIIRWGPPHNSAALSRGGKILEYKHKRYLIIFDRPEKYWCVTRFVTDSQGIIVDCILEGNDCIATENEYILRKGK
jgi:hypothetical protein